MYASSIAMHWMIVMRIDDESSKSLQSVIKGDAEKSYSLVGRLHVLIPLKAFPLFALRVYTSMYVNAIMPSRFNCVQM